MASLIKSEDMIVLKSASEVKTVADEAMKIHEEQSVAYAINSAANSGQHSIIYAHNLSDAIKEVLRGQGYSVTKNGRAADPDFHYIIGGF